jgi:hypothetical protein
MKLFTLLLSLFVAGVAGFAALNWAVFATPVTLSFIVTSVDAPLGLIMLYLVGVAVALASALAAHMKTTMLLEARAHAREMQVQRKLADATEASRLTVMQHAIEIALQQHAAQIVDTRIDLGKRIDLMETNMRASVDEGSNVIAAYIGELDDRLARRPDLAAPTPR